MNLNGCFHLLRGLRYLDCMGGGMLRVVFKQESVGAGVRGTLLYFRLALVFSPVFPSTDVPLAFESVRGQKTFPTGCV